MKLIDAEELKYKMRFIHDPRLDGFPIPMVTIDDIDNSPKVDASIVIHARWEENDYGWLQCSNCGHCSGDTYDEWLPVDAELSKVIGVPEGTMYQRLVRPRYCGYCGAKMEV